MFTVIQTYPPIITLIILYCKCYFNMCLSCQAINEWSNEGINIKMLIYRLNPNFEVFSILKCSLRFLLWFNATFFFLYSISKSSGFHANLFLKVLNTLQDDWRPIHIGIYLLNLGIQCQKCWQYSVKNDKGMIHTLYLGTSDKGFRVHVRGTQFIL